jgi:DNA-binding MarR family transcriptional regulator
VRTVPTAERLDTRELAGRLRFASARLIRHLRRQDEGGLGATPTAALATIVRSPKPLTLGELAVSENLSKPSITKVVERLEHDGLITRQPDAADKRVCRVKATAKGVRQLEANRARRTAWLDARLQALTGDEQQRLAGAVDVLEKLIAEPQQAHGAEPPA